MGCSALADIAAQIPESATHLAQEPAQSAVSTNIMGLVFLTDRAVSPTNNGSEQALRPCVIFCKITNGFRSRWGADLYADVRSVLETARRRGVGILHALRLTLDGQPLPSAA